MLGRTRSFGWPLGRREKSEGEEDGEGKEEEGGETHFVSCSLVGVGLSSGESWR